MKKKIKRDAEVDYECKSAKWVNEFNTLIDNARKRQGELDKEISALDLREQDILHYIEFRKCNAAVSAKLMKELKKVRLQRRSVKEEKNAITSITSSAKKSKFNENKKAYTFRTNVIVELLEDMI